jgi:hypothetical protein
VKTICGVLLLAAPVLLAQDAAAAKLRYEKPLLRIRGVQDVSISDGKIVVRVENEETRDAVRTLAGDQLRLQFTISGKASEEPVSKSLECPDCGCPCHRGRTVAEPRKPEERKPEEECDILRALKGLPQVKRDAYCKQMVGWTNDSEKIRWLIEQGLPHWESREWGSGPKSSTKLGIDCPEHGQHNGEFVAYTYHKHRASCPYGQAQGMDDFRRLTPTSGK